MTNQPNHIVAKTLNNVFQWSRIKLRAIATEVQNGSKNNGGRFWLQYRAYAVRKRCDLTTSKTNQQCSTP